MPRGPREGPKRPLRGLQEASLQPCFQEAPKSPQEAPKSQNLRMILTFSTFMERHIFGIRHGDFCTFGSKARPSVLQSGEQCKDHSLNMHLGNLLLASAPCACHVVALLGSSSLFHASSKVWKTLGPFVKKVLRPPAGTLRGPTCSFTCVLQVKLALGLENPQFLR